MWATADPEKNIYNDESGLNITLKVNADNTYTIKDKSDNRLNFSADGYLSDMKDSNGNTLTLGYTGTTLTTVTDGVGRVTTLSYQNGHLASITDPGNRTTSFRYTNGRLTGITYPDHKQSTYLYDSGNKLIEAVNFDGYKVVFSYYNSAPYRILKVQEAHTDGTLGQELIYDYAYKTTVLTDVRGRKNVYEFNNKGNTINIRDWDGNAQYYKYYSSGSTANKLSLQSKLQRSVMNYIRNHNAEVNRDWAVRYDSGSKAVCGYTAEAKYLGRQSLKINKTIDAGSHYYYQQLTLEKGQTYTLSAYIKTRDITKVNDKGAFLSVIYKDGTGADVTSESRYVNGSSNWERYEVKFTLPQSATSDTVTIKAGIAEETGTVYFDCLQLEDGPIANRYNLVENADLTYGAGTTGYWSKNTSCNTKDTMVTTEDTLYTPSLSGNRIIVYGEPDKTKKISQTLYVSGKKGDVYAAGGWAKGDSVSLSSGSGRYFAMEVLIHKTDGTDQQVVIPFCEESPYWQYVSDKITADGDYASLTFSLVYANNANTAYFDGLQLYKEEFGETYQYDDKGNLTSAVDTANNTSSFAYNDSNDLTKYTSPENRELSLNYDSNHNLLDAASSENVVNSFTYDGYGNALTSKVGDDSLFIMTSSTYTADGNYLSTSTDGAGNTVTYDYNETIGVLDSETDAKGGTTSYLYDSMDKLTDVYKSADGREIRNTYVYENDRIKQITHNGFSYFFDYDSLGNILSTSVGSKSLATNTYELRTSKLLESKYGNGQKVSSDYDRLDRVIANRYNGTVRHRYEYDASGNLGYHEDLVNGISYRYFYDIADKLVKITDSQGNIIWYEYDDDSNNTKFSEKVDNASYMTAYGYDRDSRPSEIIYSRPYLNDESIEHFPLNDSTAGSRGTTASSKQGVTYERDGDGKPVLLADTGTKVQYDLGIGKNQGSMFVWFNTAGSGTRYVISNEVSGSGAMVMYIGSDSRLKLAVKNSAGALTDIAASGETVQNNTWYFAGFKWKLDGTALKSTLYIKNDANSLNGYEGSSSSFKDFTNAITTLGSSASGTNSLNGYMEQFSYATDALDEYEIAPLYNSGRGTRIAYTYDTLGRLTKKTINTGEAQYNTVLEYIPGINGSTTDKVMTVTNAVYRIDYTYDANWNIETIAQNGKVIKYYYNELNELIREDNQILDKTILYAYDAGGNFTSRVEYGYTTDPVPSNPIKTYTYAYDSAWKDKLIKFDGKTITYDAIGNPLNDGVYKYTWEEGRQLASISKSDLNVSFKYNDDAIRTQKTVNGVTTKYHLAGDRVTYETNGADRIYYTYGSDGNLVSMNLNGKEYYYIRNAQGDIIGLFDSKGEQVVSYTYDTWGKLVSITGSAANTVGAKNPYRYRGYRYDTETGLYYLQSRYYDPEWGRFINADDTDVLTTEDAEILDANLFTYCLNDPVNNEDSNGYSSMTLGLRDPGTSAMKLTVGAAGIVITGRKLVSSAVSSATRAVARLLKAKTRSKNPPAKRKEYDSKKSAKEAAKKAGKGNEPRHDPNGHEDDPHPHYHPNVPMPKKQTPKAPNPHDHYYYPRGRR